jgi:hypothetical protein
MICITVSYPAFQSAFEAHPWYKKRIDGTPLENDLAVIADRVMRRWTDADALIIEGLRAEIAALTHQRDEARQECKQAVVAERERMCEIIKDHYWDSLNFGDIGKAHGVGLIKKIMESGNG